MTNEIKLMSAVSMTSREIAELVNSRHTDVKRSIERLAERGVIRQAPTAFSEEINNLGFTVKREHYIFTGEQGKRDSIIVVAQLSPEFTARLVDRWQELEAKQLKAPALPDFTDPAAAARAWADQYEAAKQATIALEAAKPAIEFHERVGDDSGLHSIDEVAKVLRAPVRKTHQILKENLQMFRQDGLPKQEYIKRGIMRVIEKPLPNGSVYPQAYFTGKGLIWVQQKIDHDLIGMLI